MMRKNLEEIMEVQKEILYHNKLKRLSQQMRTSEHLLQNHPLMKGKWAILHTLLNRLNFQMQWTLAGPTARLLIAFQTALHAQEREKSQTGFIGPALQKLEQRLAQLLQLSLHPSEQHLTPLLLALTEVIIMGKIFLGTQLVENWKKAFPKDEDPVAAEKAGLLLKELGLTFLLGSRVAESAFRKAGEGLGLKKDSKEKVTDIGMCIVLLMLMLTQEKETMDEEAFWEKLKQFLLPALKSVETTLREAGEQLLPAVKQMELLGDALSGADHLAFKQTLETGFDLLGISLEEIKKDINQLSAFCTQLNKSFNHIFDRTAVKVTTVQAA